MTLRLKLLFVCLFLCGAGLRAMHLTRPITQPDWRECDEAGIARNFYREGMNILYPRVDWRGTGPGYAEMEFPLQPWLMAVLYQGFGCHEVLGRVIAYSASLLSLALFFGFARYLLPPAGAFAACLFFTLNPMLITMATAIQPEGLMFFFYLLATFAFVRWLDHGSWRDYGIAAAATALTILAKASAAHIGLLFGLLVLQKMGPAAFRSARVWFFAIAALLPGVLWYAHARNFWLTYGNSLGLTNEYHWAGWDLFTNPMLLEGVLRQEVRNVWTHPGALVAVVCLFAALRERTLKFELCWLLAVAVFYLAAARTTRKNWSYYYHMFSVPPAALLMGTGIASLRKLAWKPRLLTVAIVLTACLAAFLEVKAGGHWDSARSSWYLRLGHPLCAAVLFLVLFRLFAARSVPDGAPRGYAPALATLLTALMVAGLGAAYFEEASTVYANAAPLPASAHYRAALQFKPLVSEPGLIVASGGAAFDPSGYPLAYNGSYMFYWLDRKGFNTSVQNQSVAVLRSFAKQGARYFIAEKTIVAETPGLDSELRAAFPLLAETDWASLYLLPHDASIPATPR